MKEPEIGDSPGPLGVPKVALAVPVKVAIPTKELEIKSGVGNAGVNSDVYFATPL